MVLQRWDPFGDLRRAETRFNRAYRDGNGTYGERGVRSWAVPVDVITEGDDIVIKASLPGVKSDDVSVTVDDGVLTIKAESSNEAETDENGYLLRERRSGAFRRSLRLADSVDADHAESSYENGVLTIRLPKQESKKAKAIEVEAA